MIPVICLMYLGIVSCDLLIINYLCGRITNPRSPGFETTCVVICSELTTFAVESPTSWLGDCTSYQMSHHLSRSRRSRPFYIHSYTRTPFQSSIWLCPILQIRHQVTHYLNMEDGWKITLSFKLSSSPYHIHLQPVTPFLEDMADFFTHSGFYICKSILIRFAQKLLPVIIPLYQISSVPFCLISCEEAPTIISNSPASSTRFIS